MTKKGRQLFEKKVHPLPPSEKILATPMGQYADQHRGCNQFRHNAQPRDNRNLSEAFAKLQKSMRLNLMFRDIH